MPKRQGSHNYSTSEQTLLLTEIRRILPLDDAEWNAVAAAYNAKVSSRSRVRAVQSLKRKFGGLCRSAEQTTDFGLTVVQKLARDVKLEMDTRAYRAKYGREKQIDGLASPADVPSSDQQLDEATMCAAQTSAENPSNSRSHPEVSSSRLAVLQTTVEEALSVPSGDNSQETRLDSVRHSEITQSEQPITAQCTCVQGHLLLEQQLNRFRVMIIRQLQDIYQLERNARNRERKINLECVRRYHKQLQESVLALSMEY